jgi:hypothetical protein
LGCGDFERFEPEALDVGEDIVGGFGPAEGFWIVVDCLDRIAVSSSSVE